ncbi:carbonic anhydrase 2, partial [Biomphalaria pfeifferi]
MGFLPQYWGRRLGTLLESSLICRLDFTISSVLIDDAILRSLAISSLRLFVEPTDIMYTSHEGWSYLRSNNVDMTLTLRFDKLDQLSKTDIKLLIPEMEPEYIHINTSMSEKEDVLAKMFDIVEAFEESASRISMCISDSPSWTNEMIVAFERLFKMALSPRSTYSLTVAIFISVGISTVEADATTWNYEKGTYGGPDNWFIKYPDCGGKMQSPINIPAGALCNPNLRYFNFSDYASTVGVNLTLTNKGDHTVEVEYSGTPIILRGGSLPDEYKLVQYHFHWGAQDSRGSEHLLDGKHFPMELHLVHHQAHLADVKVAMSHPFGLAVLGFFFQVSPYNNTKLDQLLEHFDLIRTVAPQQGELSFLAFLMSSSIYVFPYI